MIRTFLDRAGFSEAANMLPKELLDHVDPQDLTAIASALMTNFLDLKGFRSALAYRRDTLRADHIAVHLRAPCEARSHHQKTDPRATRELLHLFTHQLESGSILLDLRPASLGLDGHRTWGWCPRPLYFDLSPEARSGLKAVLDGFARAHVPTLRMGLHTLGLEAGMGTLVNGVEELVRGRELTHMSFYQLFRRVFKASAKRGTRFNGELVVVTLYLAVMVDALCHIQDHPHLVFHADAPAPTARAS